MSYVLEYLSLCMALFFVFFTCILCFKLANYFANEWFLMLKQFGVKIVCKKDRKDV